MSKVSLPLGMRPGDAAVIAAVLLCAVLMIFVHVENTQSDTVTVRTETDVFRYPLPQKGSYTFHSAGYTLTLTLSGNEVYVSASDCPGGDCMHTGVIRKSGQSIVCMPARTVITLAGEEASDADWILP